MIKESFCSVNSPARESAAGVFPKEYMRALLKAAALFMLLFIFVLAPAGISHADDGAQYYSTKRFDVTAKVSKSHIIHVEETITCDFHIPRHGIYRYIPVRYKFYRIQNVDVEGDEFESEFEMVGEDKDGAYGRQILQIGSGYRYVEGEKTYRISYDMVCNKDDSDKEDYMSLDLLPTGWSTPIESASITLLMPKDFDWKDAGITYGKYGSSETISPGEKKGGVSASASKGGKVITVDARDLPQGEGMTFSATLNEGYWEDPYDISGLNNLIPVIPIGAMLLMFILWLVFGRDPHVVKPVEFYPPEGLTPAEVGFIVDGRLDDKDLSSMIMYYASKGYIKIEAHDKKRYKLRAVNPIADSEPEFAKTIFKGLFDNAPADKEGHQYVDMDELPNSFATKISLAKDQIKSLYDYGEKQMFSTGSKTARAVGRFITVLPLAACMAISSFVSYRFFMGITAFIPLIFGLIGLSLVMGAFDRWHSNARVSNVAQFAAGILIFMAAVIMTLLFLAGRGIGLPVLIIVAVSSVVSVVFEVLMWARTKENAAVYGKVLGFREFIRQAEYNRLKEISKQNPEYYYDIIPYAFVMGMSTEWAKKFENLKIPEPEWISGVGAGDLYTAMWYSNMMNSCSTQFSTQSIVIDSADSGGLFTGGGFSGGGFSGGGFGGGGGGSW